MAQAHPNDAEENGLQKGLVLVVDDDSRTRRLEKFVLEEEGFPVETVGSGEEALEIFGNISPVLILLDVNMPGIDGFTTCQRIREISQVPIIMVTGENRDEDKVRGLEMGADDYVTKPFAISGSWTDAVSADQRQRWSGHLVGSGLYGLCGPRHHRRPEPVQHPGHRFSGEIRHSRTPILRIGS